MNYHLSKLPLIAACAAVLCAAPMRAADTESTVALALTLPLHTLKASARAV